MNNQRRGDEEGFLEEDLLPCPEPEPVRRFLNTF